MAASRKVNHTRILGIERKARAAAKERLGADGWKRRSKQYNLKKYGLTVEMYDAMHIAQDGKCAICGGPPGTIKGFHVDHNHLTNKVRGLLCHICNQGMMAVDKSIDWCEKALMYKGRA